MSTFGMLLKMYRERAGLSQADLAAQAGLSASTISRVEKGERGPLSRRKQVLAAAKALHLDQSETDTLLSAADLAPSMAPELLLHPRDETLYRIAQELEALRTDPDLTPAQVRFVEETLLLVLRGARSALPEADLTVVPSGTPTTQSLSQEERYLDDLLGDYIAGRLPSTATPFAVFAAVARSPRWELKRRLTEALPALLQLDPTWTLPLMETLREDPPDPEWRTDIRRRVIEAAPVLWKVRPEAVPALLHWREGDEVYATLASLDALTDVRHVDPAAEEMEETWDQIQGDLLEHTPKEQREPAALYAQILECSTSDPDAALKLIQGHVDAEERLVRVCLARSLHRLLPSRAAETLKLMRYFLQQQGGQPLEHQNVRRAVARHPQGLIGLLGGPGDAWATHDEAALALLRTLAADRDVHIRRVLSDVLSELVSQSPEATLDLIEEYLLQDRDRFVQERTWNALRELMSAGSERAEELCARLIELA
jgi:transcriptional regulator with XRE-family HTH domain